MKRTPWSLLLAAAAIGSLAPSACSDTITQPAQLPDCMGTPDASCNPPRGSPGGGVTVPGDASTGLDAPVTEDLEGGGCGQPEQADMMIASNANPAFPACAPCITAAPGSGAANCCPADIACSGDSGCLTILQCVLMCLGKPGCVQGCEGLSQSSVPNYDGFASCLALNCPTQCPSLNPGTAATGDI